MLEDKLDDEGRSEIDSAMEAAKEALDSDDVDTLKEASEALTAAAHKLASVAYEQAEGAEAGPASAGSDDDVIDAEYEES